VCGHIVIIPNCISVNWQIIALSCACISTTIATAYDTLGEEGLTHSLNEPNSVGIFTNAELLPTLLKVLPQTPAIKYVIYDGEPKQATIDSIRALRAIQVLSISQLREIGKTKSTDILESRLPKKEDMALIMYTSGSTGAPKGVCITHANLIASVGAVKLLLGHHFTYEDSFLAYLPLAHVLEYIVELVMIFVGMPCGYGRVKTLTDASVRNCKGDIGAFRPSIMVGVPAVWESIRKGIIAKVNEGGPLKKAIFDTAMYLKKNKIPGLAQLADSLILSGVRAATGGRLRIALCGGAAISRDTQDFLTTALVPIIQGSVIPFPLTLTRKLRFVTFIGYGMTESCGMCAILPPELIQYESVGLPVPSIEIKLLDVADAGYLSSNTPPQGEVCIRGPSVLKGYYKRPDLNSDENIFTKDGWLRTGDIGQWNADGTVSLIDRLVYLDYDSSKHTYVISQTKEFD
jgi:long-chain acyl-CoA synthetase